MRRSGIELMLVGCLRRSVGWLQTVIGLTLVRCGGDLSLDSTRNLLEQSKMTPVSGVASTVAVKQRGRSGYLARLESIRFSLKHKYNIVAKSDHGLALLINNGNRSDHVGGALNWFSGHKQQTQRNKSRTCASQGPRPI